MDKVIGVVDTSSNLPEILKEVSKGKRFIITQRSKARAALISLDELETVEIMADRKLLREIREAREDIKSGNYVTYEQYFKEKPK